MEHIMWEPKKVKIAELKENPNNPKIITELGKKRLNLSLSAYGLAGTLIVNKDLTIIDGHSRKKDLVERGIGEVWVSVPDRLLTQKEYDEMNALYDKARAGETDMVIVEEVVSEDVLEEWELGKKERSEIKTVEIKPFVQTHVLISFSPEKMIDVQPYLQKITEIPGVEYEQTSN